jgi:hypothetical protein
LDEVEKAKEKGRAREKEKDAGEEKGREPL